MKPFLLLLASFALLHLAAQGPADDKKKAPQDAELILGKWEIVAQWSDGEETPAKNLRDEQLELHVTKDELTYVAKNGVRGRWRWSLDPTAKPKRIDLEATDPALGVKPVLGIYLLDGDKLTICVAPAPQRPDKFESIAGSDRIMNVFKRIPKPKE